MSKAKICRCGHNASDHKQLNRNRTIWGECFWYGCECKQYFFEKLKDPNAGAHKYIEQLETLIDASIDHSRIHPPKRKNEILVSECRRDGTHPDFKPNRFNNGEYI